VESVKELIKNQWKTEKFHCLLKRCSIC